MASPLQLLLFMLVAAAGLVVCDQETPNGYASSLPVYPLKPVGAWRPSASYTYGDIVMRDWRWCYLSRDSSRDGGALWVPFTLYPNDEEEAVALCEKLPVSIAKAVARQDLHHLRFVNGQYASHRRVEMKPQQMVRDRTALDEDVNLEYIECMRVSPVINSTLVVFAGSQWVCMDYGPYAEGRRELSMLMVQSIGCEPFDSDLDEGSFSMEAVTSPIS